MTALPCVARKACTPAQLAAADAWPTSELQSGILQRGRAFGWLRVHFTDPPVVNTRGGVRHLTAFVGDAGFPDTLLVHPTGVLVAAEIKPERGYPRPEQRRWIEQLASVPGVLAGVWRPRDWYAGVVRDVLSQPELYRIHEERDRA